MFVRTYVGACVRTSISEPLSHSAFVHQELVDMPLLEEAADVFTPPMTLVGQISTHKLFLGSVSARRNFPMLYDWGVALAVDCRGDYMEHEPLPRWRDVYVCR